MITIPWHVLVPIVCVVATFLMGFQEDSKDTPSDRELYFDLCIPIVLVYLLIWGGIFWW